MLVGGVLTIGACAPMEISALQERDNMDVCTARRSMQLHNTVEILPAQLVKVVLLEVLDMHCCDFRQGALVFG